jgi:predicted dehydrogenase
MTHGHHQTVALGMIGSGFVADFYMAGLDDVPGAQVVANYSRSAERAEDFGGRYGIPRQYTDVEALCADDEVQMVIIGLPNHMHRDAIRTAAQAGKAIVCTKPLARNADEAAEIVRIVREAGVLHGYAETEVFAPNVVKAREMIESGARRTPARTPRTSGTPRRPAAAPCSTWAATRSRRPATCSARTSP